jgi:hypothetical protein
MKIIPDRHCPRSQPRPQSCTLHPTTVAGTGAPAEQDQPPLEIVPLPFGHYTDPARNRCFDADAEAAALAGLLAERLGGTVTVWDTPSERRDLTAVGARLTAWAKPPRARNSVLAWIGHGTSNDTEAALVVPDGDGATTDEEYLPADLARRLRAAQLRRPADAEAWDIVLVKACSAGRTARVWCQDPAPSPEDKDLHIDHERTGF